jgi:hypothetical protein
LRVQSIIVPLIIFSSSAQNCGISPSSSYNYIPPFLTEFIAAYVACLVEQIRLHYQEILFSLQGLDKLVGRFLVCVSGISSPPLGEVKAFFAQDMPNILVTPTLAICVTRCSASQTPNMPTALPFVGSLVLAALYTAVLGQNSCAIV